MSDVTPPGIADADWIGADSGPEAHEFAANCCPQCGHVLRMPTGKPNDEIRRAMETYPEIPRQLFVCTKHGKWLVQLDDLFPVYWHNNKCKECS